GVTAVRDAEEAEIGDVLKNGAADNAGIQAGDVIIHFGKHPIKNFADLIAAVAETDPGDKIQVQLQRDEEIVAVELVIGKYRPDED
ncbi:MAG: PDZ domain-containing protein, partial [Planctomycetales bacterium]